MNKNEISLNYINSLEFKYQWVLDGDYLIYYVVTDNSRSILIDNEIPFDESWGGGLVKQVKVDYIYNIILRNKRNDLINEILD